MSAARPIALFLALALAWPSPAAALRPQHDQTGLEEALSPAVEPEESLELSPTDRTRLQRLQVRLLDILTDPRMPLPPDGRLTPAWILRAVPGTRYQDLYLINLPAVVAQADAHLIQKRPQAPRLILYWRNNSQGLHITPSVFKTRLANGRVARFFHEYPGGNLSPMEIVVGAKVHISHLLYTPLGTYSGVDVRALSALANASRAIEDSPRPPVTLTEFLTSHAHEAVERVLQPHPGGYLPLKELARLAGISRRNFEHGYVDPYLLMAVVNARRAVANLRHPKDLPQRFIALDGLTAILHAIDQHPGDRTTRAEMTQLTGLAIGTLARDHPLRALIAQGSARRTAETPPRPALVLPPNYNPQDFRSRPAPRAAAGLEEPASSKTTPVVLNQQAAGRGVVVIPAAALAQSETLQRELKRLSPNLAQSVLLWGDTPLVQEVAAAGNIWVYRGPAAQFVTYLQGFLWDRDATKAHVLTDDTKLVSGLSRAAASIKDFGAQIERIPMESLTLVFKTLGAPNAVLERVGLEEVRAEQYVGSGT